MLIAGLDYYGPPQSNAPNIYYQYFTGVHSNQHQIRLAKIGEYKVLFMLIAGLDYYGPPLSNAPNIYQHFTGVPGTS